MDGEREEESGEDSDEDEEEMLNSDEESALPSPDDHSNKSVTELINLFEKN